MKKYAIGVDFGTLSARALLVDIANGDELATCAMDYPHGVIDDRLPCGLKLKPDWALQDPRDYLSCLRHVVPRVLSEAAVDAGDVIGVGVDFTTCTMLPIDERGLPLCFDEKYASNPHAWVKLWKHHAAQKEANMLNEIASARGERFLARYGGKISSEWMIPKIWQTLNEAPEIYSAADRFIEAGDWVVMSLTGKEARSSCMAGYKALWDKDAGYPSEDFFAALDERLRYVVDDKLSRDIRTVGEKAGELTDEGALLTGLRTGTSVAVCCGDAHVALPPAGITGKGKMMMIIGTSTCDIMLSDEERIVPGMCGVTKDGVIAGLLGYEAGQSCVGDHFNWFVENLAPARYESESRERGMDLHQLLTEKAAALKPGESGLVALDWWNGNRSVLVDVDLSGLLIGMTLATKPEEIYRALIEATAYGARTIVETFEASGVKLDGLFACGGIAQKNPFLMQLYADVLGREIHVVRSTQASALGSAMFGAVAAGAALGGYETIDEAAARMGGVLNRVYAPRPEARNVYDRLYAEYATLHDYFGRGANDAMKRLRALKAEVK